MATDWEDEAVWTAAYQARIGDPEYGADWQPVSFSGGVATAVGHGLAEGAYVLFRNVQATTPVGDPAEKATYRTLNVTADTFEVVANAPGFPVMAIPDQTCEFTGSRHGEVVTYGNDYFAMVYNLGLGETIFTQRWVKLKESFPTMSPSHRFLVVGCATGKLNEAMKDDGYPFVYGLEKSQWLLNNRGTEIRGDIVIVADDIQGGGRVAAALRQVTKDDGVPIADGKFHWVITEDVVTSYQNAELPALLNAAETVLETGIPFSQIIHMVTEAPITRNDLFNSQTLEAWNALRPAHSWVSIRLSQWRVL